MRLQVHRISSNTDVEKDFFFYTSKFLAKTILPENAYIATKGKSWQNSVKFILQKKYGQNKTATHL